ncbi:MAG: hypothetical protein M1812_003443 [Candelaria pacifica]|nr:MAG: hypothetical protein M1812_003443 [Candelaria pacifica]
MTDFESYQVDSQHVEAFHSVINSSSSLLDELLVPLGSAQAPRYNLGLLSLLPLELLHEIFEILDIQTLHAYRFVNHLAKRTVESLPSYRLIYTHAREALHAILKVCIASHFTITTLSSVLRTNTCCICSSLGDFLYLPTLSRCCSACLFDRTGWSDELLTMRAREAKLLCGLSDAQLTTLVPIVKTSPASYHSQNAREGTASLWRRRREVVNRNAAIHAGVTVHGSYNAMERHVGAHIEALGKSDEDLDSCPLYVPRGFRQWGIVIQERRAARCLVSTAFPCLDLPNGETQTDAS